MKPSPAAGIVAVTPAPAGGKILSAAAAIHDIEWLSGLATSMHARLS